MNMKKKDRLRFTDPFGDYDKDGVPNIRDCEPTNPKKHGVPLIMSRHNIYDLYAGWSKARGRDPTLALMPKEGQRFRNFGRYFARFWYVKKVGGRKKR